MKPEPEIMQRVRELCLSCQDCKYFMRHYIQSSKASYNINGFTPICKGHCTSPDRKRRPDIGASDAACQYFEPKEER